MVMFVVHTSFNHFPPNTPLKQSVQLPRAIGCNRIRLVGYQVTFKSPDVGTTPIPDHIIVAFKNPDWMGQQMLTASPPAFNDHRYPDSYGIPLACEGHNTVRFGLTGLSFNIASIIPRNFDVEVFYYDDRTKANNGTDTIVPMTRPTHQTSNNIKLDHLLLYFSVDE